MQTDKITNACGQPQKVAGSASKVVLGHSDSKANDLMQKQFIELAKSQTTALEGLFARLL